MKPRVLFIFFFLFITSVQAQKGNLFPGDTITIDGPALKEEIEDILLNINYRKLAKIRPDEDSVNYHFIILSVDRITDYKFRVRVVHAPVYDKTKTYITFQDPFVIHYQLKVVRKKGKLYLKEFKYLVGEI